MERESGKRLSRQTTWGILFLWENEKEAAYETEKCADSCPGSGAGQKILRGAVRPGGGPGRGRECDAHRGACAPGQKGVGGVPGRGDYFPQQRCGALL